MANCFRGHGCLCDNRVPQGSGGRDCLGRRRVRRIESTYGPIFGSCLVNSDGRSNGISPSPIAFAIFLHSVLGRTTTPRTIFPYPFFTWLVWFVHCFCCLIRLSALRTQCLPSFRHLRHSSSAVLIFLLSKCFNRRQCAELYF